MEVVRGNFKQTLPQISASIKKADFLAIDAEFTGLLHGREVGMFDSPEEYYKCVLYGCTDFLVVQFGLCCFYWDEKRKHYLNDAYNFYLFPRRNPGPEKFFLCQASSLDFLSSQGFDFNKAIRDGISYMSEPVETRLREQMKDRQKPSNDTIIIPDEHKTYVEETCKKVRVFLDEGKSNELLIDRCNSFLRLLLYQELKKEFKDEILLDKHMQENRNVVLKVTRITSANDEIQHSTSKQQKELNDLEDSVGFSKVARMISQSEKLVIGHNMLLDMIHTLSNFFQPLPDDYLAFKEFAHCMFPNLLDTKYMSILPPFKDKVSSNVLSHLFGTLKESPFSIPTVGCLEGRGYTTAEDKQHEAGFDAYITGLCFLAMHAHLSRMRGEDNARASPKSPALRPFLNKLFLARTAQQDSPCMNLTGADPEPARDHAFILTFPKDWKRSDINLLFSPYGGANVQFLDETSAVVALMQRHQTQAAARGLSHNHRIRLMPYAKYKKATQIRVVPLKAKREEGEKVQRAVKPKFNVEKTQPDAATTIASGSSLVPQKATRDRTSSASSAEPPPEPNRKRTSSGVFEIDAEPPPKKPEPAVEAKPKASKKANGRRKDEEKAEDKEKPLKIIETFDSEAKSKCVSAFKESDSWD